MKNNLNKMNSQLGYYLAGLIEGDGNIWVSKEFKSSNGRIYSPQIGFTFSKNEIPLYEYMRINIFNTENRNIYLEKNNNSCKYCIADKKTLIEVINLINGKFRTPKIIYLHRAIDRINLKYGTNIEKLHLDKSNIDSNAWLAGFSDADGNFIISLEGVYGLNNSQVRGRVKCNFSLAQRMIDIPTGSNCIPFMTEIADLFQCKINFKGNNAIYFQVQSNNKHYITKNYFDKYPLMSSKYLNYLDFIKGLDYLGKRLTNKEIIEVQILKNSMNNKRTKFNWDHLRNFYKK
jgi:hypothetical protein